MERGMTEVLTLGQQGTGWGVGGGGRQYGNVRKVEEVTQAIWPLGRAIKACTFEQHGKSVLLSPVSRLLGVVEDSCW